MIFISSSAVNGVSIENCLEELINIGIRNIELSGGIRYSDNILKKLKNYKKELSLNFLIHNYFPPSREDFVLNIASLNELTRTKSVNFIKASINLAHDLGVDCYTLHAGYAKELQPARDNAYFIADSSSSINMEVAKASMFKSLNEIKVHAIRYKVKIGLENLFPINTMPEISLLCTPLDIFQFLDSFAEDDFVGILLDLGHLCISANYFGFNKDEFINKLSRQYQCKIFGIHLSGNNGEIDLHSPLAVDSWQLKVAKNFNLEKIPLTIECRKLEANGILHQLQIVENFLKRSN